ncbi:hypothetical protein BU23DRAFT_452032, partial [Bimuria novae-zelandiae CBS 107.79]
AWGIVIDITIWSPPHYVVWQLQLRRSHKIAISFIFGLGLINLLTAVSRIVSVAKLNVHGDLTYGLDEAIIWMYAQLSTAIILACCPLLRPFFEKLVPQRLTRIRVRNASTARTGSKIQRTTRILVHSDSSEARSEPAHTMFIRSSSGPEAGPSFHVQPSDPVPSRRRYCT